MTCAMQLTDQTTAQRPVLRCGEPAVVSFLDWMARQDAEYRRRPPVRGGRNGEAARCDQVSGNDHAGRPDSPGRRGGADAHLKRAIEHGAGNANCSKPDNRRASGRGRTVGLWIQILTQLDEEGAFKNGYTVRRARTVGGRHYARAARFLA